MGGGGRAVLALGATIAVVAGVVVFAQPKSTNTDQSASPAAPSAPSATAPEPGPPGVPLIEPPPEAPANATAHAKAATNAVSNSLAGAEPPPAPPPPPPKPVRSPAAILQALDKVTAETMRFAVPVGAERVRYKNLVFTVKACETSGLGGAEPEASAYVVIESAPLSAPGVPTPPHKEVYRGWMYANSPALHPFQHPIYDAWLIACMASAPKA